MMTIDNGQWRLLMRFMRMAGIGALGAAAGILGLYVVIVLFTLPYRGGLDLWNSLIVWVSVGGVVALLITVHLVYARILLRYASEGPRGGT
jgi:hypothetical protein